MYEPPTSEGSTSAPIPPMDVQIERWTEMVGGEKKGRVYGLAGLAPRRGPRSSYMLTQREEQLQGEICQLQGELDVVKTRLETQTSAFDEVNRRLETQTSAYEEVNRAYEEVNRRLETQTVSLDAMQLQIATLTQFMTGLQHPPAPFPPPTSQFPYQSTVPRPSVPFPSWPPAQESYKPTPMNQERMPNFEAVAVLEALKVQRENINLSKKPSDEILNEKELIAAEVLYELAIGLGSSPDFAFIDDKKAERKLGKRKFIKDGSTSRSHKRNKKNSVNETNNHEDCSVQSLCNKAITGRSGNQNCLRMGSGKLITGAPSTSGTSTYPTDFPFSVIHLLSAVRAALVTPISLDYAPGFQSPLTGVNQSTNAGTSAGLVWYKEHPNNLPSLTLHQIVLQVRSNPGDTRILECKEPLVELVRGVLKIFSSETAPFGATQWKPLTTYDNSSKTWLWTGPIMYSLTQENCSKVEISSTAWGISQENLVNLGAQYSLWLRGEQPVLQLIAKLPAFPLALMQVDFHTRFNNRKRSNPNTINQSCDEVRACFQREEAIRYLIPDRVFHYTALDGKKSTVAPFRTNSNRSVIKTRGHYIFKPNRRPQFSLLSLIRDAAARLPSGLGTRADICILTRDSQYIVDNIPEKTVKQIVSGALDRLRCEPDPCVEYNGKWGLWVYLHKEREEEDFLENVTFSVKIKNKKRAKENVDSD